VFDDALNLGDVRNGSTRRWRPLGSGERRDGDAETSIDVHCTLRAVAAIVPNLRVVLSDDLAKPSSQQLWRYATLKKVAALVTQTTGFELRKSKNATIFNIENLPPDHAPLIIVLNGNHSVAIIDRMIIDPHHERSPLPVNSRNLARVSGLSHRGGVAVEIVAARGVYPKRSTPTTRPSKKARRAGDVDGGIGYPLRA